LKLIIKNLKKKKKKKKKKNNKIKENKNSMIGAIKK